MTILRWIQSALFVVVILVIQGGQGSPEVEMRRRGRDARVIDELAAMATTAAAAAAAGTEDGGQALLNRRIRSGSQPNQTLVSDIERFPLASFVSGP